MTAGKHFIPRAAVMLTALLVTIPSYQAFADHRWDNDWSGYSSNRPYQHNRLHRHEDEDYTTKSVTQNASGEDVTTRTHVERDRDSYRRTTTVKGPNGLISREKEELEYDDDEVTHSTRIRNSDGTVDVNKQTYDLND